MKESIRKTILEAGACAVGFAKAEEIEAQAIAVYHKWISDRHHAGMDYLARHAVLKVHPRNVLESAASVISIAFSYSPGTLRPPALPVISCYAYGEDYHEVIRRKLTPVITTFRERFGGDWKVCVDTAPLAERYWAMKCGIGRLGKNGSVIIDGYGSMCFLAEILTSCSITPDMPSEKVCDMCGACVSACPTNALNNDGTINSSRCLNYLTIEHRGEWTGEMTETMHTEVGKNCLYGCDICQTVCPHNHNIQPTGITEFFPSEKIMKLDAAAVADMTHEEFSAFFKGSAIKRAKYDGLLRNALNILRRPGNTDILLPIEKTGGGT